MASYRERLYAPVSYWLLAVPVVLLLGAEAYFFVDGLIPVLIIAALAVIVAVFLIHWSTAAIVVEGSVLRAGADSLPLSEVEGVAALDVRQSAAMRGPRADPLAHLLLRPYLNRAVYVGLADPEAGVPYWLLATRHPERLAAVIEEARHAGGGQPGGAQPEDRESVG